MEALAISDLIDKVVDKMREYGYSADSIYKHAVIYRHLNDYAKKQSIQEYNAELGECFLRIKYGFTPEKKHSDLRPMDEMAPSAIRKLSDMHYYGCFYRKPRYEELSAWAI